MFPLACAPPFALQVLRQRCASRLVTSQARMPVVAQFRSRGVLSQGSQCMLLSCDPQAGGVVKTLQGGCCPPERMCSRFCCPAGSRCFNGVCKDTRTFAWLSTCDPGKLVSTCTARPKHAFAHNYGALPRLAFGSGPLRLSPWLRPPPTPHPLVHICPALTTVRAAVEPAVLQRRRVLLWRRRFLAALLQV